jgi:hypothetical protein
MELCQIHQSPLNVAAATAYGMTLRDEPAKLPLDHRL